MNQMPYSFMPNPFMVPQGNQSNYDQMQEMKERINQLERKVRRLENKVFQQEHGNTYDYSQSPPKDSGMYMM